MVQDYFRRRRMKRNLFMIIFLSAACLLAAANDFKEGNELYLGEKYEDALKKYGEFLKDNSDRYEGFYNAGNALFRLGQYEQAIKMYEEALKLKPGEEDIMHNMEVARSKLPKDKQQEQQTGGDGSKEEGDNRASEGQPQQGQGEAQASSGGGQSGGGERSEAQKKADSEKLKEQAQKSLGMSEDEIQALMNMMQQQEKRLQGYFGNQQRQQQRDTDFPDFFNMSPDEIMRYMERRMMDPQQQGQRQGSGGEKDW